MLGNRAIHRARVYDVRAFKRAHCAYRERGAGGIIAIGRNNAAVISLSRARGTTIRSLASRDRLSFLLPRDLEPRLCDALSLSCQKALVIIYTQQRGFISTRLFFSSFDGITDGSSRLNDSRTIFSNLTPGCGSGVSLCLSI